MYASEPLGYCCRMELAGSAADALLPLLFCEQDLYQVCSPPISVTQNIWHCALSVPMVQR
jgi:hypothetical protein